MAEEFRDPRETDWHPRHRMNLLGHSDAEQRLLQAFRSGRMHHAWLLTGKPGIGKATLAYRFARFILATGTPSQAANAADLSVPPEAQASRWMSSGAHPDLFELKRAVDPKRKRLKTEIAVDDARRAVEFFGRTSGTDGWRVAIVDSMDDLNLESANALLKVIEEPPPRSLFLLISNQPGRMLRTIRSRCIRLDLSALSVEDTVAVIRSLPAFAKNGDDEMLAAARLSGGSPGRAVALADSKGADAFANFLKDPRFTPARSMTLANYFGGQGSADDLALFGELLVDWVGNQARQRSASPEGLALAKAHDEIVYSLRQTDALNLDRRQTVIDAMSAIRRALQNS